MLIKMMYNKCFYHSLLCENKNQNIKNIFYKKNLSEMSTPEKRSFRNVLGWNILGRNVLGQNVRVRNVRPPMCPILFIERDVCYMKYTFTVFKTSSQN